MSDLHDTPSARTLVAAWLRAQPEMVELVDDRVTTRWAGDAKQWPAVRVDRVAGGPVAGHGNWLHDPLMQFYCAGGEYAEDLAERVALTAVALLERRLRGVVTVGEQSAVVSGVETGSIHEGYDPVDQALAVCRFDARVWLRPR